MKANLERYRWNPPMSSANVSNGMYKSQYGNHDFSPLASGVYITDPITEMGVAHAFEPWLDLKLTVKPILRDFFFHKLQFYF